MAQNFQKQKPKLRPSGVKDKIAAQSRARRVTQGTLVEIAGRVGSVRRNDLVPDLHIEMVETSGLRPASRQVRRRDARQSARLLASVRTYGVVKPILINASRDVIEGHGILDAAKKLGIEKIPVIVIDHLDQAQQKMLRLALNRLGETGDWDFDELKLEFEELITLGCDLIDTGFETAEIDALLLEEGDSGEEEELGAALASVGKPVSRPGDVWLLGRHRLLQGDARYPAAFARLMLAGETARIVFTDVPYNVRIAGNVTSNAGHREFAMATGEMSPKDYSDFNGEWIRTCLDHLADGGLLASFIDWRSLDVLIECGRRLGLELLNLIVWAKSNAGQGSLWPSQHELLPVFKKGSAPHVNNVELGRHGRWRSNVWPYAGASSLGSDARDGLTVHPTVKPRAMLEDALLDVTDRDEIVIDPFVGSGSTLLAAEATGRVCRAIEIDGQFCEVVIRRWQAMTGEAAVLERTGETFAGVAERGSDEGAVQ